MGRRNPHLVRHYRSFLVLVVSDKMFCAESTVCKERSVPGEGLEPSASSLWAKRVHQLRQLGIFFQRIPAIPVHRNCILGRDPSHQFIHREKENPVVADRVRVELCLRMSLPKSVLVWAGLLVKALEAWVLGQVGMLAHAYGRDPSLDVVCSFHSSLLGSMIIDPY